MNRCNPKERRMSILQTLNRELGKRKSLEKRKKVLMQKRWSLLPLYCGAFATGFSQPICSLCFATILKKQSAKGRMQFLFT